MLRVTEMDGRGLTSYEMSDGPQISAQQLDHMVRDDGAGQSAGGAAGDLLLVSAPEPDQVSRDLIGAISIIEDRWHLRAGLMTSTLRSAMIGFVVAALAVMLVTGLAMQRLVLRPISLWRGRWSGSRELTICRGCSAPCSTVATRSAASRRGSSRFSRSPARKT